MIEENEIQKKVIRISASEQMQNIVNSLQASWANTSVSDSLDTIIQFRQLFDSLVPANIDVPVLGNITPSQEFLSLLDSVRPSPEVVDTLSAMEQSIQRISKFGITQDQILSISQSLNPIPDSIISLIESSALSSEAYRVLSPEQSHLKSILSVFEEQQQFVGVFEYNWIDEPHEEKPADSNSESLVPESVSRRLIEVDFFPIEVIHKIREDPQQLFGLTPREFERMTAELLSKIGFTNILLTPYSGDGGRDIVATKIINGIPILMAFECKKYAETNRIEPYLLRALLGTISTGKTKANMGVLVTTSSFTPGSTNLILSEIMLDGKDFDDIVEWINEYGS